MWWYNITYYGNETVLYIGNWRWILKPNLDLNELGNSNPTSETVQNGCQQTTKSTMLRKLKTLSKYYDAEPVEISEWPLKKIVKVYFQSSELHNYTGF